MQLAATKYCACHANSAGASPRRAQTTLKVLHLTRNSAAGPKCCAHHETSIPPKAYQSKVLHTQAYANPQTHRNPRKLKLTYESGLPIGRRDLKGNPDAPGHCGLILRTSFWPSAAVHALTCRFKKAGLVTKPSDSSVPKSTTQADTSCLVSDGPAHGTKRGDVDTAKTIQGVGKAKRTLDGVAHP